MANTIITKNSATTTAVPTAGQLVQGELAVNVTDKRLFTENSGGTVVELGTNPSSVTLSSGTANGVTYLNGSKVLTSGSALTFDGTKLTVKGGNAGQFVLDNANEQYVQALFQRNGTVNTGADLLFDGTASTFAIRTLAVAPIVFSVSATAGNPVEGMRLTSTGLGIGTTTIQNSSSGRGNITLGGSSSAIFNLSVASANSGSIYHTGSEMWFHNRANGPALFFTNDTERMRIDSAGNVGIGTSAPNNGKVEIQNSATTPGLWVQTGGTSSSYTIAEFRTGANAPTLVVKGDNKVGVGTTSPVANLSVAGGASNASDLATAYSLAAFNIQPKSTSGYSLQFGSGPSDLPYIQMSAGGAASGNLLIQPYGGNVGVGSTSTSLGRVVIKTPNSGASGDQVGIAILGRDTYNDTVVNYMNAAGSSTQIQEIFSSNGTYQFVSSGSERFRIDSAGNVGIGTSSMTRFFNLYDTTANAQTAYFKSTNASGGAGLIAYNNTGQAATFQLNGSSNTAYGGANSVNIGSLTNNPVVFIVNNTERVRIDSGGGVRINNTANATFAAQLNTQFTTAQNCGLYLKVTNTSSSQSMIIFGNTTGDGVGSITTNGSSTSYNTSSDYRLKEGWVAVADASTRVNALKPINFAWIANGARVDGFLAHELAGVVPEAVTGEKDAVDAEGNPVYQGIDQSKLVPLLTAALQEALAEINALKARLDAANI